MTKKWRGNEKERIMTKCQGKTEIGQTNVMLSRVERLSTGSGALKSNFPMESFV